MEFSRELAFRFPLMRGEDVRAVQQALTVVRTTPPAGVADGIFGNATRQAIAGFQRLQGLEEDGVVGRRTWAALFDRATALQAPLTNAGAGSAAAPLVRAAVASLPPEGMPMTQRDALKTRDFLMAHFGDSITRGAADLPPLDADLVCAIACKETAPVWVSWIARLTPETVLARCVFDASGDAPNTSRGAFPRTTAEFRARAGDALTDDLINEANETRRLRGYSPAAWVYKGYGVFQYDLQHFPDDPDFFAKKQWRSMDACMDRFRKEMKSKLAASGGDLPGAVRRYNGSGPRAEEYAKHVMQFYEWLRATPPSA